MHSSEFPSQGEPKKSGRLKGPERHKFLVLTERSKQDRTLRKHGHGDQYHSWISVSWDENLLKEQASESHDIQSTY